MGVFRSASLDHAYDTGCTGKEGCVIAARKRTVVESVAAPGVEHRHFKHRILVPVIILEQGRHLIMI
jgi:hypothetical protein